MEKEIIIVVGDSDDEFPLSAGERTKHVEACEAFWTEWEKKKKIAVARSRKCIQRKRGLAVADSSSTADSSDSEDVAVPKSTNRRLPLAAGASRKCSLDFSSRGSRKRRLAVAARASRKCIQRKRGLAVATGGSRKLRLAVASAGSRKRRQAVSDGRSRKMIHKLTESYDVTGSTIVTTVDKVMIREFLEFIFPVYKCSYGTCSSIIVHTLTSTDVNRKQMKLPKRMVPTDLELTGDISVRFHPGMCVNETYEVLLEDDGRVKMTCWKDFLNEVGWKVKTKIVMMFYRCDDYTCLFVSPLDARLLHK